MLPLLDLCYVLTLLIIIMRKFLHFACLIFVAGILFAPAHSYGQGKKDTTRSVQSDGLDVPFYESFETQEDFDKWKVYDLNNDSKTWKFNATAKSARCLYSSVNPSDDWLFSPAINLKKGIVYQLTYTARASSSTYKENLKVTIGTSADPAELQTELAILENHYGSKTFTLTFEVSDNDEHYIGFYAYSPKNQNYIEVTDIKLEVAQIKSTPQAVEDLAITPAALGALSAELKFKTPTLQNDGAALTEITAINIYKNKSDEIAGTIMNPAIGEEVTWTDNSPVNGFNIYTIIPVSSNGEGTALTDSAYIGMDIPLAVTNFKIEKANGKAVLTWDAPTSVGKNGGYVDAASLKYNILRNDYKIIADITGTTYTDDVEVAENTQTYIFYFIEPSSELGSGTSMNSNFLSFGTPYQAPFNESFANAKIQKAPWIKEIIGDIDNTKVAWTYAPSLGYPHNITPQDGDGGFAFFNSASTSAGASMRLISPAVSLNGLNNPVLSFWFYHIKNSGTYDNDKMQIEVSVDGATFEDLESALIQLNVNDKGWTYYEFPLDGYTDAESISIAFKGISGSGYFNMAIDNISIKNNFSKELEAVSIAGPGFIQVDDAASYVVTVKNNGKTTVTSADYKVILYKNDEEVASQDGKAIAFNASETFTFNLPKATLQESGKDYSYYAFVDYDGDELVENNTTIIVVTKVVQPTLPSVADLSGSNADKLVTLTWSEPLYPKTGEVTIETKTENFESYAPFIIDNIGDWTVVDVDGGETYGPSGTAEGAYPNVYGKMAFQVYSPSMVDADIAVSPAYKPHSGSQYLIAWGTPGKSQTEPNGAAPNDDWLISPELSGYGETLSFFAKAVSASYGSEKFQVLYSMTGKDIESFVKLNSGEADEVGGMAWTEFTYQIPLGAKHFAIRYVSNDVFGLMIDDISYTTHSMDLIGYNVYRNYEKITATPVTELVFTDNVADYAEYVYTVTAVYDKGEAYFSNEAIIDVLNGIGEKFGSNIKVYSKNGTLFIDGAEGLYASVISIDGQVLSSSTITETTVGFEVPAGVYLIKIANEVTKVLVK